MYCTFLVLLCAINSLFLDSIFPSFLLFFFSSESLIGQLFELTQLPDAPPILMHQAFKYLYLLSKVRGSKVVVRWFSHEVVDLEPVLTLLQQQDRASHEVPGPSPPSLPPSLPPVPPSLPPSVPPCLCSFLPLSPFSTIYVYYLG